MQAIIFDFNGVIADDEGPHVRCFCQALEEFGLRLSVADYYGTYLGMDERTCTVLLLTARDGRSEETVVRRIQERKAELFRQHTVTLKPPLFPGVIEFVTAARGLGCHVAIASGGRREQIDRALEGTPLQPVYEVIVSAEDCPLGKPDPAIYRLALARLNDGLRGESPLQPGDCLVIEDSQAGIRAARAAGMPVLGVATTYRPEQLQEANLVVPSLAGLDLNDVWACLR